MIHLEGRGRVTTGWTGAAFRRRLAIAAIGVAAIGVGAIGVMTGGLLAVVHAEAPRDGSAPQTAGPGEPAAQTPPAPALAPKVRIVFKVFPPTRATVTWGKKKLGIIKPKEPLIIERPRDSGPLDVVVRAEGCVPVHTRAYTFTSTTVPVKVTPLDKKNTIYGYREEPPPDADGGMPPSSGGPDGGAPP